MDPTNESRQMFRAIDVANTLVLSVIIAVVP